MQMRKWLYEPKSKKSRATAYRAAALECERAGFTDLARVNYALANWIDPPPREERPEVTKVDRRNGPTRSKGPDHSRVGGRRDAAPVRASSGGVPKVAPPLKSSHNANQRPQRAAKPKFSNAPRLQGARS